MYAVFEDAGNQYRAEEGATLRMHSLSTSPGEEVRFEHVMLLSKPDGVEVGTPTVPGAVVVCEVEGTAKGKRVVAMRRRVCNSLRSRRGSRADYTVVKVKKIEGPGL